MSELKYELPRDIDEWSRNRGDSKIFLDRYKKVPELGLWVGIKTNTYYGQTLISATVGYSQGFNIVTCKNFNDVIDAIEYLEDYINHIDIIANPFVKAI